MNAVDESFQFFRQCALATAPRGAVVKSRREKIAEAMMGEWLAAAKRWQARRKEEADAPQND